MSQWRGVLRRLMCFIRLIDFLVMELLRRLVLAALRTLLAQVKASSTQGICFIFCYLYIYKISMYKARKPRGDYKAYVKP